MPPPAHSPFLPLLAIFLVAGCTKFTPRPSDATGDLPPERSCATHEDCVGFPVPDCADPVCDTVGRRCAAALRPDKCMVDGVCVPELGTRKGDPCRVCLPGEDPFAFVAKPCGAGTACDPETGACRPLADATGGDCGAAGCGDVIDCGGLGCCAEISECAPLPGVCTKLGCGGGLCQESVKLGACFRALSLPGGCVVSAVPADPGLEPGDPSWEVDQPSSEAEGWRFQGAPAAAIFSQSTANSGRDAWLVGPVFSISAGCAAEPAMIQVEHRGEMSGAVPHLVVRGVGSREWKDLGALPGHAGAVPGISTILLPADLGQGELQIALRSRLSAVVPTGSVEVRRIRVATGAAPVWKEPLGPFTVSTGQVRDLFIRAEDPEGEAVIYEAVDLPPFVLDFSFPATDPEGNVGLRIRLSPKKVHAKTWNLVVDARDGNETDGRVARLSFDVIVESASECGDKILDAEEDCDLGASSPVELCTSGCTAPQIQVAAVIAEGQANPDVAAFGDVSGRVVVAWEATATAQDRDVHFRLIDTDATTSADIFRTEELAANADTSADEHHPRVAMFGGSSFVIAWQQDLGPTPKDVAAIRYRLFNGTGSSVDQAGDRLPYPASAAPSRRESPDVAGVDSGRIAMVWVERKTAAGGGTTTEIVANTIGLADLSAPPPPFVLVSDPDRRVELPRVMRRSAQGDLLFAWREIENGAITRTRFTVRSKTNEVQVPVTAAQSSISGSVGRCSLLVLGDGGFLVAWEHTGTDGTGTNIKMRRFDPTGQPLGPALLVNGTAATLPGNQFGPALASNGQGEILVSWYGESGGGSTFDVHTRLGRLGDPGAGDVALFDLLFGPVLANPTTGDTHSRPSVAGLTDGRFAMVWQQATGAGASRGIKLRIARLQGD